MNIANLLMRAGRAAEDRPAVAVGGETRLNYGTLAKRAAILASQLRQRLKCAPGDRVALVMGNCRAYIEVLFACWHAGLTVVPVNAKLHVREFAYILDHCGARVAFVTADLAPGVAALASEVSALKTVICVDDGDYARLFTGEPDEMCDRAADDMAWLFYTSGTTGQPKGAVLTHRNLLQMTLAYFADVDTIAPDDCILHPAPMSHGSGMYILPHVAAMAKHVIPASGGFDPKEIFQLIARHRGASFFAAPTMVRRLIDSSAAANADTRNLKTIVYGGGPMYVADCKRAMTVFGNKLAQIYGQGESPMTITALNKARHAETAHPRYEARLASVGVPHTGVELRIAAADDTEDRALPPGEVGEVLVRGDVVMPGYWGAPEATAETLRNGWLHTGDLGVLDGEGFLTLRDRSKDLIISGGANIYPREVEEVLMRHPGVAEASVVGVPDEHWGEIAVAFIVPISGGHVSRGSHSTEQIHEDILDRLCLNHLARFKRPRRYLTVRSLPKNNYGKVLKSELKRWLVGDNAAAGLVRDVNA